MDREKFDVKGKKILVVGLGRSGIAASQVLCNEGANVWVQDQKSKEEIDSQLLAFFEGFNVEVLLGEIPDEEENFDLIVLSPGVDPQTSWISKIRNRGCEVIGELELAYRLTNARFVAITGTNGKTTTTTLVGEIFKEAGLPTHVVGNIGVAVIAEAINAGSEDWMVTEASSFQLETTFNFRPQVATLLNLTPDHMDRHKTMEAYGNAKGKIFANQGEGDYSIVNAEDRACVSLAKQSKGRLILFSRKRSRGVDCFVEDDIVKIRDLSGKKRNVIPVKDINLVGSHNLENVLAAVATCFFAGIKIKDIEKAIREFRGVPHRLEPVANIDGVFYYNDSKGTNTDATITAIRALKNDIILIAGGDAKGQEFESLAAEFKDRVKALVLLGRDRELIAMAARKQGFENIYEEKTMQRCVERAAAMAHRGDKVLLSPACASWDMYENFQQRGDDFKSWVLAMEK
ncbi:MAG: UDP-N-acetylmuramoyl-L-alanine--D-glutamate ligase [Clostridiales bacterium]|nr:UDP-N-acetylmuramoyl-L-alanine--D-glutamate ligase [Clostridiales bacterium]